MFSLHCLWFSARVGWNPPDKGSWKGNLKVLVSHRLSGDQHVMWLMKREDAIWDDRNQSRASELRPRSVLLTELLRPHQKHVPTSEQHSRNQSTIHAAGLGREGLGGKCWEDGQFRKVVIKALHLWRVLLGRGINVVGRAFIISLKQEIHSSLSGQDFFLPHTTRPRTTLTAVLTAPHLGSWRPKWQSGENLTRGPQSRNKETPKIL